MADQDVDVSEEVVGSEPSEAVAGSDSTIEDGGTVAVDGAFAEPFKFGWHDGSQWEIKSRQQLAQELGKLNEERRHSTMRHEDLQTERQKLAEERKAMQDVLKKARDIEARANSAYSMYKPWDDLMNSTPQMREEIEKIVDRYRNGEKQSPGEDALAESLLQKPEFQEMREATQEWKKDKEAREQERKVAEATQQLKAEIADYDETAVNQFLTELAKVPQQDGERKLREVAHYAMVGMTRAGLLEQRKAAAPQRPSVSSTPGKPTTGPDLGELDPDEQYNELVRRVAEIPE